MLERRKGAGLMAVVGVIALLLGWHFFSDSISAVNDKDWTVSQEGILEYKVSIPQYNLSPPENDGNTTLSEVQFQSREAKIAALLRIPRPNLDANGKNKSIPGIVLLPGATVTKERGAEAGAGIWQSWVMPASPLTREIWVPSMHREICRNF